MRSLVFVLFLMAGCTSQDCSVAERKRIINDTQLVYRDYINSVLAECRFRTGDYVQCVEARIKRALATAMFSAEEIK